MDQSSTFARHFSRLVWLLMNESDSVDEQKMALRALVQVSKVSTVDLKVDEWQLLAGDAVVPGVLTGVQDLVGKMVAHSALSIHVNEGTGPADLLGFARILASGAVTNDGGEHLKAKLAALSASGITFVAAPIVAGRPSEAVPAAPAVAAEDPPADPRPVEEPPTVPMPVSAAEAKTEATPIVDSPPPPVATPAAATPAIPAAPAAVSARTSGELRKMSEASAALLAQLSGRAVSSLSPEELLDLLDKAVKSKEPEPTNKILDDLITLAEHSARVGKPKAVLDILHGVLARYSKMKDGDVKSVFALAARRLSKPALLRAVAGTMGKHPEKKQFAYDVLQATGEDGAEAIIEQVGQARSADERATMLEVLGEHSNAVPALIKMLGDARWFVVRNAADLLGELKAKAAEDAITALLRHNDDRVRRSATNALLKLGTTDALKSVYDSVNDASPEVRMQVAAAISTRKDSKTAITLIRAIDGEGDNEVQQAMIAALGKVGTPDAVQKLVKLAEAEKGLFKKKDNTVRLAAVIALGEARSPAALNALKELSNDKDREVRDTATRTLAQVGR